GRRGTGHRVGAPPRVPAHRRQGDAPHSGAAAAGLHARRPGLLPGGAGVRARPGPRLRHTRRRQGRGRGRPRTPDPLGRLRRLRRRRPGARDREEDPRAGAGSGLMTRLIPDWEIRITNFGLGYILMSLVVAIAATNTGNNNLYIVLAAMLAAMVVSGVISRRNVRGVSCEIEAIDEVTAERPALLRVRLENRLRAETAQALFFVHEGLPGPLWIDPLKPGERREIVVGGGFPHRGVVRRPDAGLLSRFPLGLFRQDRRGSLRGEIVVDPLPPGMSVPEVPPEDAHGGRPHPRRRGGGSDIRTLRDFVPGDDPRDLHWKQSARMRRWIVRERDAERDRVVVFAVENGMADPDDPSRRADFERVISRCAGQVLLHLSRGGEAGFQARGLKVPAAAGRSQRGRILGALGRLGAVPIGGAPPFPPMRRGDLRRLVQ